MRQTDRATLSTDVGLQASRPDTFKQPELDEELEDRRNGVTLTHRTGSQFKDLDDRRSLNRNSRFWPPGSHRTETTSESTVKEIQCSASRSHVTVKAGQVGEALAPKQTLAKQFFTSSGGREMLWYAEERSKTSPWQDERARKEDQQLHQLMDKRRDQLLVETARDERTPGSGTEGILDRRRQTISPRSSFGAMLQMLTQEESQGKSGARL